MSLSADFDFFAEDRAVKKKNIIPEPAAKNEQNEEEKSEKIKSTRSYPAHRYQAAPKVERRMYPERVFDRYAFKRIQIRQEDYDFLGQIERAISHAKRQLPEDLKSNQRITANTIIRMLLEEFCLELKQQFEQLDFTSLQLEEEVQQFIRSQFNRD